MVKKLLKHKVLCWLIPGGFFTILSTLFITILVTIGAFLIVQADGSNGSNGSVEGVVGNQNLSQEVLSKKSIVEKYAREEKIPEEVPVLLAIMMVESGGKEPDPMQSSESAGLPQFTLSDSESSIRQGVKHYKKCLEEARALGNDRWTAVQSYNFGRNYNVYVAQNGKVHSTKLADQYSLKVVAPSLGNTTGQRYKYNDPIAVLYNGGWLYLNGGNFFYCDKVKKYITTKQEEGTGGSISSLDGLLGQTINGGQCYGLTAYYVTQLGGPQLMGSGKMYASQIGTDYEWTSYGWEVIVNPSYEDIRPGDVINYGQGGVAISEFGHTGIVASVDGDGKYSSYEQNAEKGQIVAKYLRQWSKDFPITTSLVRKK
ncbi:CHAP domain-containing protein [Enterococcus faecalis]|nr:CHAP domain-containing protein [Enterococcus faecalis]